MARAAATGTICALLVELRRPRGCGAGSSGGTGSEAGWLLQSPWVRSWLCLFCLFSGCLGFTASFGVGPGWPSLPGRWAFRSCRRLPQVRAQVSLRGLPGWHSQSAQQNVRLTPTSVVASLHYRNSLKPSPNHRSRAGEERSERPGRNCGASAQTATRDLPSRESCLNLRARNLLELVPALRALRRRRALRHLLPKSQCGERLPEVSLLRREVEDGQAFGLAAQRRSQ